MEQPKKDRYHLLFPVFNRGLKIMFNRDIHGTENILEEPALYVANHIRATDSLLIAQAYTEVTGEALRFGAKKEYFDGKGIDNKGKLGRTAKWLMESTGQIPVDRRRENPRALEEFMKTATGLLESGESIALHPEGTRSPDGRIYTFRATAARIAMQAKVPLVPVGLVYDESRPLRRTPVTIRFGEPITPEDFDKLPYRLLPRKLKGEHFSDVAERRVAKLTGKERAFTIATIKDPTEQE